MKYNKKIEKYNDLIDKGNKPRKLLVYACEIILFMLIWKWFDWQEVLIFFLIAFTGYLLSKYRK